MEHIPYIAIGLTAVFVLMSIPMAISVGLRRTATGISLLHGDDDDLLRRIRAHGNFIEYVPLALLILAAAEVVGVSAWIVAGCGVVLLLARVLHYFSLRAGVDTKGRALGAALTTVTMAVLAVAVLWRLFEAS